MTHSRVALVSGGAQGIGAAIADYLVAEGYRVVVADKQAQDGVTPSCRRVACDISKESEVNALMRTIRTEEGRLDALICNAGFMIRKPISELSLTEWNTVLGTNLTGMFLLAKAAESMLREAKGNIITISSTRAHMSEPNTESYSASKGGVLALTHALAVSLGPDVTANCISPGWINSAGDELRDIDHSQHPAGRVGTPEDIARMVLFLLDAKNRFITGSEFVVDGGMTRKMIYEH
jgi:NAD(P)-dependent dehydrogenase (short-subunit alcohol dehydrogenase family)